MTTYNTGNPIGSTDPKDLYDNAESFDRAINDSAATFTDRLGNERPTLKRLEVDYPLAGVYAGQAALSAENAQLAETGAVAAQAAAVSATMAAEAARDAAQLSAGVYATTAAGLAATTSGKYFSVPSADSAEYLILYQNSSGTAVEVKRYPSASVISPIAPIECAFAVLDAENKAAIAVAYDGTFQAEKASIKTLSITGTFSVNSVAADSVTANAVDVAGGTFQRENYAGYVWAVSDGSGKAAIGVKDDGTFSAQKVSAVDVTVDKLTIKGQGLIARNGGVYSHQINFINNSGQSLGEGSTPSEAITAVQEYDNVGFAARASSHTAFVPLTVANTQYAERGESPMYGALGHIKELIAEENGIGYQVNDYQLAACNNAYSGTSITGLNKGTSAYSRVISQIQSAFNIAASSGKTMAFQATTWTQGEADYLMGKDVYKNHLKKLANDYNADAKAITGQYNNAILITYQSCTAGQNVALAQAEAANESDLVYLACPMYQFDYGDSQHINALSSKWLGAYYGIVYKRVVVDKQEWQPLQPVYHAVNGNVVDIVFSKNGLVLDTTLVPAQPNYGFSCTGPGGEAISVTSVAVVSSNRVRITLASSPASGSSILYGNGNAVGKSPYIGFCGNLRDSQGDSIVYAAIGKPMHNWCVIFKYSI